MFQSPFSTGIFKRAIDWKLISVNTHNIRDCTHNTHRTVDDYVYGGRSSIAATFFGDAPTPMFTDPPGCFLHKQGNFITSFFPEGLVAGEDYDFFYLPGIDPQYGNPVFLIRNV